MNTIGHLINGESRTDTARTQDVFNPSTGEVEKQVALASKATVKEAIAAAQAAYPVWRDTPPARRARVMFRFKELLEQNAEDICKLIGEEHGKIIHDAMGELQRGIENVEYACYAPELLRANTPKTSVLRLIRGASFNPSAW